MIAFGVAIASQEKFDTMALPGLERVIEADSRLITRTGYDSIQAPYNEILDEAVQHADLEAVVLLHEDTEIIDPDFCATVRQAFADPSVGAIGPIGGRGVDSLAWWQAGPHYGRVDAPNVAVGGLCHGDVDIGWHDVEALDGLMIVVSPWVARRVRFDMRFAPTFHGYDMDYSFQVRGAGKRCVVAPLEVRHHGTWKIAQGERWKASSVLWEQKWGVRRALYPRHHFAWA